MKRMFYAIVAGMLLLAPMSCKKDDPAPSSTLPSAPEALAEHDDKSGGVYKGTYASPVSTGTIKVVLQGGVKEVIIVHNGVSKTLTTTDLASWTSGQEIVGAIFNSGDWQADLTAAADGSTFDLNLLAGGESGFNIVLIKENSTVLVRVYEGTYAGDATGKWNFTVQNQQILGVYSGLSGSGTLTGTVTGTGIAITDQVDVTASGTFAAEMSTCSGTWASSSSAGTWSGARKI